VLGSDVGVFDGVGGWAMVAEGDAALYSRMFANITAETIGAQRAAGIQQVDIAAALHAALKVGRCRARVCVRVCVRVRVCACVSA
jgi:hypothetical protein